MKLMDKTDGSNPKKRESRSKKTLKIYENYANYAKFVCDHKCVSVCLNVCESKYFC